MSDYAQPINPKVLLEQIEATVDQEISHSHLWRVKFQGSYWFARPYGKSSGVSMRPGESVRVVAMEGITLLVLPHF